VTLDRAELMPPMKSDQPDITCQASRCFGKAGWAHSSLDLNQAQHSIRRDKGQISIPKEHGFGAVPDQNVNLMAGCLAIDDETTAHYGVVGQMPA
jgi:hypothetical protein